MSKKLITTTETYRVDEEYEVEALINEAKADDSFLVKSWSSTLKEKKKGGEIIDSGYQVKITKEFDTFWEV